MTHTDLIGTTRWEQALYRHLTSHVDEEAEILDSYQKAADDSQSAAFRYLVSVITDEERRHHAMFSDLAKTLATEVDQASDPFAVPRLGNWGFERGHIAELTETFLAQEHRDMAGLEYLEAELEPVKETTMWALLVRLMKADTAKHIEILDFVMSQTGPPLV